MDIQFSCSNCGQHIAVDESGAGLTVECPACGHPLVVPQPRRRMVSIPPPAPKVAIPTDVDTYVTGSGKKKRKAKRIILATMVVVGVVFIFALGRSVTRPDRNPLGKTEQQVERLYGQPVKIEKTTPTFIHRTYLFGDITATVSFSNLDGTNRAESVFFYRDSPSWLSRNRITMQEAQRLMREISGGGRWTIEQDDSKQRKQFETHYVYREKSLRLLYRKLHYVTVKALRATYDEDDGFLSISDEIMDHSFGDVFSIRNAFASEPVEPPSRPLSSNELAALEAEIKTHEIKTTPIEEKPTALDLKGGFREYRLGMKMAEVPGSLTKEDFFTKDTKDVEEYAVENFDHTLGAFQIDKIKLTFDRTLGILTEVYMQVSGKQNVEGVLQALKVAYGEPERSWGANQWKGTDIELRYGTSGKDFALATWTSKKVNKLIEEDRTRRAKDGATDAARGL